MVVFLRELCHLFVVIVIGISLFNCYRGYLIYSKKIYWGNSNIFLIYFINKLSFLLYFSASKIFWLLSLSHCRKDTFINSKRCNGLVSFVLKSNNTYKTRFSLFKILNAFCDIKFKSYVLFFGIKFHPLEEVIFKMRTLNMDTSFKSIF